MTILDNDTVAYTDLNRQFYYRKEDVGLPKVHVLQRRIEMYHNVRISAINDDVMNVRHLVYDYAICCFDNVPSRMQLNYLAFLNRIPLIDLGVEGQQAHVKMVDFTGSMACLYCIRDLYRTAQPYGYCTLKGSSAQNREAYIYSLSLRHRTVSAVVEAYNSRHTPKTNEFEVKGIIENIVPNTCYIASICASMAIHMLFDQEYDFYNYNGTKTIFFNRIKTKKDEKCILCNEQRQTPQ